MLSPCATAANGRSALPPGYAKPNVFVIPRETARAAIVEESPKLIPGSHLILGTDGYYPLPPARQGTRFTTELDPDNPFTVSFDPAELPDL